MPYRRLPNTDKARLRAMKTALENALKSERNSIPISFQTLQTLSSLVSEFETLMSLYYQSLEKQKSFGKIYRESFKKLRTYISHFLQVMLMAVERGDLPSNTTKYFNIINKSLPLLQTEEDLIKWSKIIIEGEKQRHFLGYSPILNPSVGLVYSYYEKFLENQKTYNLLKNKTLSQRKKIKQLRPKVDNFIKKLWNEIEEYYSNLPTIIKREKTKQFGVVYFFRKTEEKISLDDILMNIP